MSDRVRAVLHSQQMMTAVNLLFFLSMLIPNRGIFFAAYALWVVYLVFCIRSTPSRVVRVVIGLFLAFAVAMIAANLYFLLRSAG